MTDWKFVKLLRSPVKGKKWRVELFDSSNNKTANVDFGASGYEDMTIHKDEIRKGLYLARHKANEDWTRSGILTPGFWSRWLLWNLPSLRASLQDVKKRFDL